MGIVLIGTKGSDNHLHE